MKEIRDKAKLEYFWRGQQPYFQQKPPVLKLVEFEKGELLQGPLQPLCQFYIIVKGSVSIYHLTEDGAVRYISKAGSGTLLGDMEFGGADKQLLHTEAEDTVLCLALPFRENRRILENDPVFLRFVLHQIAKKLAVSAVMDAAAQTLEEKLLIFLRKVQTNHEITSVNQVLPLLHCSRRQLQRIVSKLCDEGLLIKTGRGQYRLKDYL